jgi:hypothetical protein
MSNLKSKEIRTDLSNLISNLRGEIGEIITSWILFKEHYPTAIITDEEIKKNNLNDPVKIRAGILSSKLKNDIIARLYELSTKKIGRLNFYFATKKLEVNIEELDSFEKFLVQKKFREKRNNDVSHKNLPEKWEDHKYLSISYKNIVKALAMATRIMKQLDAIHLGIRSKYLWHEMRKKRYEPTNPPNVGYLLLPYMRLPDNLRVKVMQEEEKAGKIVWHEMETKINGKKATVLACKEWGILLINRSKLLVLPQYPLQKIENINIGKQVEPNGTKKK